MCSHNIHIGFVSKTLQDELEKVAFHTLNNMQMLTVQADAAVFKQKYRKNLKNILISTFQYPK